MSGIGLIEILTALLAAGPVRRLPETSVWMLNDSLVEADTASRVAGRLSAWHRIREDVVGYCPAIVEASASSKGDTVDQLVLGLLHDQLLTRDGAGLFADLIVDDALVRRGRATLFRVTPEDAEVLYDVGRRLASRLSTSAKNLSRARSSGTTWSSSPFMRRHSRPGM